MIESGKTANEICMRVGPCEFPRPRSKFSVCRRPLPSEDYVTVFVLEALAEGMISKDINCAICKATVGLVLSQIGNNDTMVCYVSSMNM